MWFVAINEVIRKVERSYIQKDTHDGARELVSLRRVRLVLEGVRGSGNIYRGKYIQ